MNRLLSASLFVLFATITFFPGTHEGTAQSTGDRETGSKSNLNAYATEVGLSPLERGPGVASHNEPGGQTAHAVSSLTLSPEGLTCKKKELPCQEAGLHQAQIADSSLSEARRPAGLPTSTERWNTFRGAVLRPGLLIGGASIGLSDHLSGTPSSWRHDAVGYAARAGSNAGRMLLQTGLTHGLAAAARLDIRPVSGPKKGARAQAERAVLGTVTAQTAGGVRIPNLPWILGHYGANLAQKRWEQGQTRPGDVALSAAISMGVDVTVDVVKAIVITQ